jgi:hypothetical protein
MRKSIILDDSRARAAAAGTLRLIVEPIKWPVMSESDGSKRRIFTERDVGTINILLSEKQKHPCWQVKAHNRPGDDLAVKEACYYDEPDHGGLEAEGVMYRADYVGTAYYNNPCNCGWCDGSEDHAKWRSAVHMPTRFVRRHLRVLKVEARRVRSITSKEIIAAGLADRPHEVEGLGTCPVSAFNGKCYPDLKSLFAAYWNKRHGHKPGLSWADDPWCWFTTVETKGDAK